MQAELYLSMNEFKTEIRNVYKAFILNCWTKTLPNTAQIWSVDIGIRLSQLHKTIIDYDYDYFHFMKDDYDYTFNFAGGNIIIFRLQLQIFCLITITSQLWLQIFCLITIMITIWLH